MQRRAHRSGHLEDVRQVAPAQHHAAERHHGGERRAQVGEASTEPAPVERQGEQGASALRGAGLGRMVVGPDRHCLVADVGVVFDELDGGIAVVEEGVGEVEVEAVAGLLLEIPKRLLLGIRNAERAAVPVARNPDHAGGVGRRAPELWLLLDHQNVQAGMRRGERGGEASGTRSYHEQIRFDHFLFPTAFLSRFSWRRRLASTSTASAKAGMRAAIS